MTLRTPQNFHTSAIIRETPCNFFSAYTTAPELPRISGTRTSTAKGPFLTEMQSNAVEAGRGERRVPQIDAFCRSFTVVPWRAWSRML